MDVVNIGLGAPTREYLEALEEELGITIAIAANIVGTWRPTPHEHDVLIVPWATTAERYSFVTARLEELLPEVVDWYTYEVLRSDGPFSPGCEIHDLDTAGLRAELVYDQRTVIYNFDLAAIAVGDCDFDRLFGEPIRKLIDPHAQEQAAAARAVEDRQRFEEWVGALMTLDEGLFEAQFSDAERSHSTNTNRAIAAAIEMREAKARLEHARQAQEHGAPHYLEMYDALQQHPRLTHAGIELIDGTTQLVLVTEPLTLHHPDNGETRPLGRMKIMLRFDAHSAEDPARGAVCITNLDRSPLGRHHPHIPSSGLPCFGEAASQISSFVVEREFYALTDLLINWLETFNPVDSWGAFARSWFDSTAEVQEEVAA